MKKAILFLLVLALVSGLNAQTTKFLAGFNLSNYHSTDLDPQPELKLGLWGGVGLEWGTESLIGEVNLLYFQKGAKAEIEGISTEYTLSEILVPVMVKFKFLPGTSPYIFAGGEAGYVIGYKVKDNSINSDIKDNVKAWDYGLVFGAGVELWIGNVALTVEGRYHYGLAPMGNGEGFDFKTNSIAILLGLVFY
jgi:hypothetical protein